MTTVAVIIPCYRDSRTLSRALESVMAQSRRPDEIIVVNDASPETSEIEAVLTAFPQVNYIVNSQNQGLAATRNAGVQAASSEIVSFLDADDELHPQKLEMQLSLYRPARTISCCVARIGDERGTDGVVTYPLEPKYSVFTDSSVLVRRNILTGASMMLSRELFLSLGGYDESLRSCEDFDFWLRILDAGIHVYDINLPLYLYRVNENGLSRNMLNISYWELEVVKKYYRRQRLAGRSPSGESITLGIWLFKHFVRYEYCRDRRLLEKTYQNIEMLPLGYVFSTALYFAQKSGLIFAVSYFRSIEKCSSIVVKLVERWFKIKL